MDQAHTEPGGTSDQIARLRNELDHLVKEITPALKDAAARAEAAVTNATGVTRDQARQAVAGITLTQVAIVAGAFAVGWLLGRTSR